MKSHEQNINKIMGRRLKQFRTLRKMSMNQLGEACGKSYQQIQKYEAGQNRYSVGMAYHIAGCLGIPPLMFLDIHLEPEQVVKIINRNKE